MNIGIIGAGFVGGAVRHGFEKKCRVDVYDKFKADASTVGSVAELLERAKIIFVCVPTPMNPDGSCNTDTVRAAVSEAAMYAKRNHVIVIKSTVPPGTTDSLCIEFPKTKIVFNPEFLTEKNALDDFLNQDRVVVGGGPGLEEVVDLYSEHFPAAILAMTSARNAELVKYTTNCFLATKVAFANEMAQICGDDETWLDVMSIATLDERLGDSHWRVPSNELDDNGVPLRGYGLSCFPKDVNSMIHYARSIGVEPTVIEAGWKKNLEVRPSRDWEKLKGRAVTAEDSKYDHGKEMHDVSRTNKS